MQTNHKIEFSPAQDMSEIESETIALVVTSPPYPMIEMWDRCFCEQNNVIERSLDMGYANESFDLMHNELDKVWEETFRVLKPGGILCVNIGDATRTIGNDFQLFSNHSRIISACIRIGFTNLPNIIWRKQANTPNKFMGSGMLPVCAYVTLEHEYILIFRKNSKRTFKTEEDKHVRQTSSLFWEERNIWYSDLWDFRGISQTLSKGNSRERSGAFPFELPHRLINMFSVKGDIVLDPFLGTGTTMAAAIANARNSVGYEIDSSLIDVIDDRITETLLDIANKLIYKRLTNHAEFISNHISKGRSVKHTNSNYGFPVVTNQETKLLLHYLKGIIKQDNYSYRIDYVDSPMVELYSPQSLNEVY